MSKGEYVQLEKTAGAEGTCSLQQEMVDKSISKNYLRFDYALCGPLRSTSLPG